MALFACLAPFEFLMFYLRSSSYLNIFVGKTLLRAGNDILLFSYAWLAPLSITVDVVYFHYLLHQARTACIFPTLTISLHTDEK